MPTSHFLAVKIRPGALDAVFARVHSALGPAAGAVEFQDPATAHVTLFYFPAELPADAGERLAAALKEGFGAPDGGFSGLAHFGGAQSPRVAYLAPADRAWFAELNARVAARFPELRTFAENALPFVPHATLFRVKDPATYVGAIPAVERAVRQALAEIRPESLFADAALFAADSRTVPETQAEKTAF